LFVLAKMPGASGESSSIVKVAEPVDRIAFLARLDDEFPRRVFDWRIPATANSRRIGCRQVTAELICEAMKERLCLILTEPTHFPHDLVLAWGGIQDKVRRWDFG